MQCGDKENSHKGKITWQRFGTGIRGLDKFQLWISLWTWLLFICCLIVYVLLKYLTFVWTTERALKCSSLLQNYGKHKETSVADDNFVCTHNKRSSHWRYCWRYGSRSFRYKSFRYKTKSIRHTCKVDSIQTHVTSSRLQTEYHARANTNLRCK